MTQVIAFRAPALFFALCLVWSCRSAPPPGSPALGQEPKATEPSPQPLAAQPEKPPASAEAPIVRGLLLDPSAQDEKAPERFTVLFQTTKGDLHIDVRRSWAPLGADRLYTLVKSGFFTDLALFRVVSGFAAQTGIHGDPAVNEVWRRRRIEDDPVTQQNIRGTLSFASSGKDSRTTQIFLNLGNNTNLDALGFAPLGRARELDVLDALHAGYGEGAPAGSGPIQARIQREGNAYLKAEFPALDYIKSASITAEHK